MGTGNWRGWKSNKMDFWKHLADNIFNEVKDKWHSARSLILVLVVVAVFLLWAFSIIDLSKFGWKQITFSLIVLIAITAVWFVTARVQKAPKNKVGFGVALVTETKEQREKIYHDLIVTLRTLLNNSRFRYRFHFIEYPQYFAEKLEDVDTARKFLKDANLRFLVYGRVRTRVINEKETHVLQLEGVVSHRPIDPEISKLISAEFGEVFPRRFNIVNENELFTFELGADWIRFASMYIISMAAFISGDIVYSQELLESLHQQLKDDTRDLQPIIKIKKRAYQRLVEVYALHSYLYIRHWVVSKNPNSLLVAEPLIDRLQELDPDNYDGHVRRAIWLFGMKKDVAGAKKELAKCRNVNDNVAWRYSLAFLFAYEAQIETALAEYKKAFKGDIGDVALEEIIEFIEWTIDAEPERAQFYYFLGLIYYRKIENYFRAFEAFTDFLDSPHNSPFGRLRRLARQHIAAIKKKDERVNF
jgi:hypothetical protein